MAALMRTGGRALLLAAAKLGFGQPVAVRAAASSAEAAAAGQPRDTPAETSYPTTTATTASGGFRFASASHRSRSLLAACEHVAKSVREALGPTRPPHLLTLFLTPGTYGTELAEAPQVCGRPCHVMPGCGTTRGSGVGGGLGGWGVKRRGGAGRVAA